jgi:hypothetical protein
MRSKSRPSHAGLKPFPRFDTDEAAERFVDTADLSEYDFSDFRPTRFTFEPKFTQINIWQKRDARP